MRVEVSRMEFIKVTAQNLEKEHICCAISSNKDCQVISKKNWLQSRFEDGLVFLKADVRGKCFIEYVPANAAWSPIEADNYLYINCFWVSGQLKGQGYADQLLEACIFDAMELKKSGLVILSSEKKMPFLSDPDYLKHKGFLVADTLAPYYQLLYLPLSENAKIPSFTDSVRYPKVSKDGFVLYYSDQCPFNAKYVPLLKEVAKKRQVQFHPVKIENTIQAQTAPAPFTTYSLFYNGVFLTNEMLSEKKFDCMITEKLK